MQLIIKEKRSFYYIFFYIFFLFKINLSNQLRSPLLLT